MKKIYVLLFSFVFVSSFGMAKTAKSDTKHEENKETGTLKKSAKINSSKLVNHKIGSGDTLYSVARKYHTTVDRIELVNGLKKGDNLQIGRSIIFLFKYILSTRWIITLLYIIPIIYFLSFKRIIHNNKMINFLDIKFFNRRIFSMQNTIIAYFVNMFKRSNFT